MFCVSKEERATRSFLDLKAESTRRGYRRVLHEFSVHLGCKACNNTHSCPCKKSITKLSSCDEADALAYLAALRHRVADNTYQQRFDLLHSYYSMLVSTGIRSSNPFAAIRKQAALRHHEQVRPTKLIDFSSIHAILNAPDIASKQGLQDKAMLVTLFYGGLRRSELQHLNLSDVTTEKGELVLRIDRTKTGQSRKQVISNSVARAVTALVEQRKAEGGQDDAPLFVTYDTYGEVRGRLSDSSIYRRFRHYVGAGCHAARATAVTNLLEHGVDKRWCKDFLGHQSDTMVEVYDKRRLEIQQHPGKKIAY